MNVRRFAWIVKFKYDYANETANTHPLRLSLFLCLSVFVFDCISLYFTVFPWNTVFCKKFTVYYYYGNNHNNIKISRTCYSWFRSFRIETNQPFLTGWFKCNLRQPTQPTQSTLYSATTYTTYPVDYSHIVLFNS